MSEASGLGPWVRPIEHGALANPRLFPYVARRAANPRLPEIVHQAVNFLNTLPLYLLLLTFLIAPLVAAGAYDEDFEPDDSSSLNSGSALDDPEYFAFLHPMIAARMQAEKEATRFKAIDEWRHSIEAPSGIMGVLKFSCARDVSLVTIPLVVELFLALLSRGQSL